MKLLKNPLLRVPLCTYLCGLIATLVQLHLFPQLGFTNFSLFDFPALILFCFVGLVFLGSLSRKVIFQSAAINVGIAFTVLLFEQTLGVFSTPLYLYVLYPFIYFGASIMKVFVGFFPTAPTIPLAIIANLASFLFILFGKNEADTSNNQTSEGTSEL